MKLEKLSPALAALMFEFENHTKEIIASPVPASRPQALSTPEINEFAEATIFVHCDQNAEFNDLTGITFFTDKGKIRTARVRLDKLGDFSDLDAVQHLSASLNVKPSANPARTIEPELNSFTANRVDLTETDIITGIIDTGIDSSHAVFANRIHSIWDQTLPGSDAGEKKYGKLLFGEAIRESIDERGHGTQVARIITDFTARFASDEPVQNDLVVVKTDFQTAHIADAIEHIFEIAQRLEKKATIILDLDAQLQNTDGKDDLSAFINQKTGDGRFVIKTQNLANSNTQKTIPIPPHPKAQGETNPSIYFPKEIDFVVPSSNQDKSKALPQFVLYGWYESIGKCEIVIKAPDGGTTTTKPPVAPPGTRFNRYVSTKAFLTNPIVSTLTKECHEFFIDVRPRSSKHLLTGGTWHLKIKNFGNTPVNLNVMSWVPEGFNEVTFI